MGFGKYRQLLTIKEVTVTDDGAGGQTEGADLASVEVWGNLTPMVGKLALEYGQLIPGYPYTFELRYHGEFTEQGFTKARLSTDKYIVHDSQNFSIHQVAMVDELTGTYKGIAYRDDRS